MSGSLIAATNEAAAAAVAASNAGTASTSGTGTTPNALAQLGSNFNEFLQLLLTQVQNQDPTDPTNTDQFTTELVQFTGVQEQVNANNSLNQLISLQQGSQVLQSSDLVGHHATVSSSQITLQNGQGELTFSAQAGEPIVIAVVDSSGNPIRDTTLTASAGTNSWQWDGTDNNGNRVPDGAYRVAVDTASTTGVPTPVTFSVVGTTTGVSTNGTNTQLQLGALSVGLASLQAIDQ